MDEIQHLILRTLLAKAEHGAAVVGDCLALREVAGEAAIFVDPTDEAAISSALARLLSAHDPLDHYRQLGLERSAQFSWQRAAQETTEVHERVAAGAESPRPSLE